MTETFRIVPAEGRVLWFVLAFVVIILIGVTLLMVLTARGARGSTFELSEAGLRIRGDVYGQFIATAELRGRDARIVALAVSTELSPQARTAGTAVPGYHAGWFRLRNREKALLYLTARDRAVYVPTTREYSLLLSPEDPERFLARLQSIAAR